MHRWNSIGGLVLKRPNILLIMTDTYRTDALKCMGSKFAVSPNIDKLARQGVMFNQAHTASPVCMPERCCIMSGLHTPCHGCIENGISRRDEMPFFTSRLKEVGYVTIMSGKTHFGDVPNSFDLRFDTKGEKLSNTQDIFAEYMMERNLTRTTYNSCEEESIDNFIVSNTIIGIEKARKECKNPFFAFCSLLSPHAPLDPFGKWKHLYSSKELPPVNYQEGDLENLSYQTSRLLGIRNNKTKSRKEMNPHQTIKDISMDQISDERVKYYGCCAYVDYLIGKLIDYLEKSGLRENTLVIFTSDHGQSYYDHGFNDKHNYFDETLRIPLILSMPGTLPQNEVRAFATGTDIAPTILGAAGIIDDLSQGFDIFTPLCKGLENPRKCAVSTLFRSMAVITERYKYIYYMDDESMELYDRVNDPREHKNIVADKNYIMVKDKLSVALFMWHCNLLELNRLTESISKQLKSGPVARRAGIELLSCLGRSNEEQLANKVCGI